MSICVLDEIIFAKAAYPRYHHSFRLRCDQVDLVFSNDFEFHTLELPKFTPSSDNIGSLPAEEKWLYLLRHAETMDADQLAALLVDPPYHSVERNTNAVKRFISPQGYTNEPNLTFPPPIAVPLVFNGNTSNTLTASERLSAVYNRPDIRVKNENTNSTPYR